MKYCEYCGKEIVKQYWESKKYFETKKYCSAKCFGAANHQKHLEREDVQKELELKRQRMERDKELSQYCRRDYVHPTYNTWKAMRARCNNPNNPCYKNYGGRGIKVCDEWDKDSLAFIRWALSHGWQEGLTLDRIDNNGDYTPENCRWITRQQQLLNRRSNRIMTLNGKSQTMKEWADELGINQQTLSNRINRQKWDDEKALTTPIDTSKIRIHKVR